MRRLVNAVLNFAAIIAIMLCASLHAQSEPPEIGPQLMPENTFEMPPGRGAIPPRMDLSHLGREPQTSPGQAQAVQTPASWDWREQGKVSSVRNQGACGSCYAFAAAADIEARMLIDGQGAVDLSENHMKECNYFERSCDGGNYHEMADLLSKYGTVLESCDPYVAADVACNSGCAYQKTLTGWNLISGQTVPSTAVLKDYIYNNGPVWTVLYAGDGNDPAWTTEFNNYDGSYTLYYTGAHAINHAVVIVGWDDDLVHDGGAGGWIVKNSWGTGWGGTCGYGAEDGYFTIAYESAKIGSWASSISSWQTYNSNEELLYHDEGGWGVNIGWSSSTTAWGLARFTPTNDRYLNKVEFWTNDVSSDIDIYIYDDFNDTTLSNLLETKLDQSFSHAGYHTVHLDDPPMVSAGDDVFVVVKFTNVTAPYPLCADDAGPSVAGKTYLSASGGSGTWFDASSSLGADIGIRARFAPTLILSVEEVDGPLPVAYRLDQNYPNPFNPSTTIGFSVKRAGYVQLEIYNLLGQKVYTLVDRTLATGNYETTWHAKDETGRDVASGVYFYRLITDEYVGTQKMLLLR
jgi:C1A family cysteine protease